MLKPNIFLLIIDSFRSDKCYGPENKEFEDEVEEELRKLGYI